MSLNLTQVATPTSQPHSNLLEPQSQQTHAPTLDANGSQVQFANSPGGYRGERGGPSGRHGGGHFGGRNNTQC